MKKYESKFKDENDKIVFPILIRTIRECGTKFKTSSSVDKIIDVCLNSRTEHSSESYFLNISFWPKDLGLFIDNYSALFVSRLINIFKRDLLLNVSKGNVFFENFCQYVDNFRSNDEERIKEVYKAINFISKQICHVDMSKENFLKYYNNIDFSDIENYKTPYDKF